jgi:hypothetical protein
VPATTLCLFSFETLSSFTYAENADEGRKVKDARGFMFYSAVEES